MARLLAVLGSFMLVGALITPPPTARAQATAPAGAVVFPTDALTVADAQQRTGRRVNLPLPDCGLHASHCAEIALVNTLDGFDLDPRVTVALSSAPDGDLAEVFDEDTLHLEPAAGGDRIGLNRLVFDPATNRLYGHPRAQLRESTAYRAVYRGQAQTFTTLSATATLVQMRRQLDDGSAYTAAQISEADRAIDFTQGELRTVFPAANVVSMTRYDEVVPRGELRSELILNAAEANAGHYAFGSLLVPSWLDADSTIAPSPTTGAGPSPTGAEEVGIAVILPEGSPPEGGWPVAIHGPGITRSKYDIFLVSNLNASRGMATVGLDPVGHAFGPRSEVGVQRNDESDEVRFLGFGRGRDLNNDGVITDQEGVQAPIPPHPKSSVGLRDGLRQSATDVMSLARAIALGVDVTGDGTPDLSTEDISFFALSLGGIYGSMLMGADPLIEVAALNVPGGAILDIARQAPGFRPLVTQQLRNRVPAQLNGGPAQFSESLPLWLDPPVTEPAPGAVAIQDTFARVNWVNRPGSPEAFAPRIAADPQEDAGPKKVFYQFAFGDQTVPNPTSATLARAFGDFDHVTIYRNDQAPSRDTNPHGMLADPRIQPGNQQSQAQVTEWLASAGEMLLSPDPTGVTFETPIADPALLEQLNFDVAKFGPDVPAPAREVERHDGPNRVATAAAISQRVHEEAETVVLARADVYADALAGGPLAVHLAAPLLLSASDGLSAETAAEIERLGASEAVLLGGEAALAAQVEADLAEMGVDTSRVQGPNRFATAAAVAAELPYISEAFVTEGANPDPARGWPDALSASAVASALAQPILLVARDLLPAETAEALDERVNVTIVGGTAAVSEAVGAQVAAHAHGVRRIAGATRYETSAAMADEALRRGLSPARTWVATGGAFPDGLVAAAATAAGGGVLLLVHGTSTASSPATSAWLRDHSRAFDAVLLAGGTAALSAVVEAEVRALLR